MAGFDDEAPAGSHHEPGKEHGLKQKIGGVPAWGWGLGLAAAILIYLYIRSRQNAATQTTTGTGTPTTGTQAEAMGGRNEGARSDHGLPPGSIFPEGEGFLFGVPAPTSNSQWAHLMIEHFIGAGEDPKLVTDAFFKYLRKERLSVAEEDIVRQALEISLPPDGYIPVMGPNKGDPDGGSTGDNLGGGGHRGNRNGHRSGTGNKKGKGY